MAHVIDLDILTPAERLELIGELWDSLAKESDDAPVSPELAAELDRRIAASEADPSRISSWAAAKERILSRK